MINTHPVQQGLDLIHKYSPHLTHCVLHDTLVGVSAYVLTENSHSGVSYWLYPSIGKHYLQHEAYCALISIGCAISDQNAGCMSLLYRHHTVTTVYVLFPPSSPSLHPLHPLSLLPSPLFQYRYEPTFKTTRTYGDKQAAGQ